MALLETLRVEHGSKKEEIAETEEKLRDIKVRIESIEALFPGNGEKN